MHTKRLVSSAVQFLRWFLCILRIHSYPRSINRDTDVYGPDADEFRPERFLHWSEKEGEFVLRKEYETDDGHCAYGFGRRWVSMFCESWKLSLTIKIIGYVPGDISHLSLFSCAFHPLYIYIKSNSMANLNL